MNSAAVWYLTVRLFAGGPWIYEGPLTETDCMQCGQQWFKGAKLYAARNGTRGELWACMIGEPQNSTDIKPAPAICKRSLVIIITKGANDASKTH